MSSTAIIIYSTSNPILLLLMSGALMRAIDISNRNSNKRIDTEQIGLEYVRLFESERKTSCEHVFKFLFESILPQSLVSDLHLVNF